MGVVSVPGMALERSVLRRRGLIAAAVIVVVVLLIFLVRALLPKDDFELTLRSPTVAAGIVAGAPVRVNGLEVGEVSDVTHLGNGQQGVALSLHPDAAEHLTGNLQADFSAGNLFGVSEVILTPRKGGIELKDGAQLTPQRPITDNTVSNMIVTIGDVNDDAIRPYMGDILRNFDASSKAMVPLLTALGSVTEAVAQTQKLKTSQTFPIIARTAQNADGSFSAVIDAIQSLNGVQQIHDPAWTKRAFDTIDSITDPETGLTGALAAILDPKAIDGLKTASPTLVILLQQILTAFPNAPTVGIQLGELMDNVRKAMPETPNGIVLNTKLSAEFPAIAAALPPLPQFEYIPPKPSQKPGAKPSAKPSASTGPSAAPSPSSASAPTSKAGS